MPKDTRHVATVTFYTYGDTPEEAFIGADIICSNLRRHYDNDAVVEKFHKQPFGTMISEEIDFKKLELDYKTYF